MNDHAQQFPGLFKPLIKIMEKKYKPDQKLPALMSNVEGVSMIELFYSSVKNLLDEIKNKDYILYLMYLPGNLKKRYLMDYNSNPISYINIREYSISDVVNDGFKIKSILENKGRIDPGEYKQLNIMIDNFKENIFL